MYLATVPGLLHEESSRVRHWGDSTRHRLRCARRSTWRPAGARTRQERLFHSDRGCQHTSAQLARHLKGYGTRPSVGRTGVCWAEPFNATLKNERVYQMVHHRKKQGHPGYCLLDRAGIQSETTPLRPGVQDTGRGRPGAPSSKTNSLKDRFQGCPRYARQSTDPPPPKPNAPPQDATAPSASPGPPTSSPDPERARRP